jgi:hypothetical protein
VHAQTLELVEDLIPNLARVVDLEQVDEALIVVGLRHPWNPQCFP